MSLQALLGFFFDLISVNILPSYIICTGQKSVLDYLEPML